LQSINSSITKFAKYHKTFNHATKDIDLNKYKELAKKHNSTIYGKILKIII
jgi:hypothetical protein